MKTEIIKKKFYNVEEASNYLGLSKSTIYKKIMRNQIPHYKPNGKNVYFSIEDLDN